MKKLLSFCILLVGSYFANAQCVAGYTFVVNPANNGEVTFTNTASAPGGISSYVWTFGDGTGSSLANPVHVYNGIDTYYVCLTIYDSISPYDSTLGCLASFCDSISVINYSATCNAHFFKGGDGFTTVYVNDNSTGTITNYLWDFGDGTTSTLPAPGPHTYAVAGIYNICLTTSNPSTLCSSNYCDTVFFPTCHSDFTFVPDASGTGGTFTSTGTGTPDTYLWNFSDGTSSSLPNPHHVFPTNATYSPCLTVSSSVDSACHDTKCIGEIIGTCSTYFYIHQDSMDLYHYEVYQESHGGVGSPGLTYLWNFGDGSTSTAEYPTHTFTGSGPFQLCLTIDDGVGCSAFYCDSINPGHSPSSVCTMEVLPMVSGIQNSETVNSFDSYPNPVNDITTITYSLKQSSNIDLAIFDLLGNKLAAIETGNRSLGDHVIHWNTDGIASGIYLLELKTGKSVSVKKIVVQK